MSTNLKEAVDFLLQEGYIYKAIKFLKFTPKAYQELGDLSRVKAQAHTQQTWDERYVQFIREAEVPVRAEGSRGDLYELNKYSKDGCKAFEVAIGRGADYARLVASTKLYYQSKIKLKVAIGRYMKEGLWRSDYDAYQLSEEQGTTTDHINQQQSDGTHSAYTVG